MTTNQNTTSKEKKDNRPNEVKRLQENLSAIRKIAGWSAETLGDKIGVTKQAISNLENNKSLMSNAQYIAIRSVLDYEIQNNKENTVLPQVIHILLDIDEHEYDDKHDEIKDAVSIIASTAAGGAAGAALAAVGAAVLPGGLVGVGIAMAAAGGANWLKKIINKKR